MPDERPTLREVPRFFRPEPVDDRTLVLDAVGEVTIGVLHEFRNHLTLLLSGTGTMRSRLPKMANQPIDPEVMETLSDMEASLHQVISLTGALDAVISASGADLRQDVEEVAQRAVRLAGPTVKSSARVAVEARSALIRNRGGMVESALAMLLIDLADPTNMAASADGAYRRRTLRVEARKEAQDVVVEIHSSEPGYPPRGRRIQLARELLGRVGAVLDVFQDDRETRRFLVILRT